MLCFGGKELKIWWNALCIVFLKDFTLRFDSFSAMSRIFFENLWKSSDFSFKIDLGRSVDESAKWSWFALTLIIMKLELFFLDSFFEIFMHLIVHFASFCGCLWFIWCHQRGSLESVLFRNGMIICLVLCRNCYAQKLSLGPPPGFLWKFSLWNSLKRVVESFRHHSGLFLWFGTVHVQSCTYSTGNRDIFEEHAGFCPKSTLFEDFRSEDFLLGSHKHTMYASFNMNKPLCSLIMGQLYRMRRTWRVICGCWRYLYGSAGICHGVWMSGAVCTRMCLCVGVCVSVCLVVLVRAVCLEVSVFPCVWVSLWHCVLCVQRASWSSRCAFIVAIVSFCSCLYLVEI